MHKLLALTLTMLLSASSLFLYAADKNTANTEQDITAAARAQYPFADQSQAIPDEKLSYIQAIKLDKTAIVKQKLEQGIQVDDKQGGRFTGLFFASAKGYQDLVELLIARGADVNAKGRGSWTPLIGASFHNHLEISKLLINKGANLELQSSDGMSALMYAAIHGNEALVTQLLTLGADANASSHAKHLQGKSVLSHATEKEQIAVVQLLLKAGAKVNSADHSGRTALVYAAEKNNQALIALLLKNGAKINKADAQGNTPLHRIAKLSKAETLQFLLDNGADSHIRNKQGKTALEIAAEFGNTDNINVLASKANLNEKQDAFIAAISSGLTAAVDTFLKLGLDVDTRNAEQETVLMIAAQNRHHLLVDSLLAAGANTQAVAKNGRDALMYACAARPAKDKVIEMLVKNNSDLKRQDKDGNTALLLAVDNAGNITTETLSMLIKAGAAPGTANKQGLTVKNLLEKQLANPALAPDQKEQLKEALMLL